jgi:hypothetical protein
VTHEVIEREVHQIGRAHQLDPAEGDEMDGQQRGQNSKAERADNPVSQRLLLVLAW